MAVSEQRNALIVSTSRAMPRSRCCRVYDKFAHEPARGFAGTALALQRAPGDRDPRCEAANDPYHDLEVAGPEWGCRPRRR